MKNIKLYSIIILMFLLGALGLTASKNADKKEEKSTNEVVYTNVDGQGTQLSIHFEQGKSHNHPTMAVWVETEDGQYIQTLYVTKSLATGVFSHGEVTKGVWKKEPGEVRRPATLPYYLHKRNVRAEDGTYLPTPENPVPDAYTGATPKSGFSLETKTDEPLEGKIVLLFEVNQPWDWNRYWNNTLYPDDFNYKTSCQPAVVYAVNIDLNNKKDTYILEPIGRSHYSGADGNLYTDLENLTTALSIFDKISATVK